MPNNYNTVRMLALVLIVIAVLLPLLLWFFAGENVLLPGLLVSLLLAALASFCLLRWPKNKA